MEIPEDFQYEVAPLAEVEEMRDETSHAGDAYNKGVPVENEGVDGPHVQID